MEDKYYIAAVNDGAPEDTALADGDGKVWMWNMQHSCWRHYNTDNIDDPCFQFSSRMAAKLAMDITSLDVRAKLCSYDDLMEMVFINAL